MNEAQLIEMRAQVTSAGPKPSRAKEHKFTFLYIVLLDTTNEPWTSVSPYRLEREPGTSAGPETEADSPRLQSTAQAILELRRRSGLTWELLSKLLHVSRRSVHHWANGKPPSSTHEQHIRKSLDAVRYLDEGSQRATRDRLLTAVDGSSLFDLLAAKQYKDIMRVPAGARSALAVGYSTSKSSEGPERSPSPSPEILLDAIQDRPKLPIGMSRTVSPMRPRIPSE